MGNSAFYYYPHPDTLVRPRQTVDLGEIISDLQIRPYRVSHDGVSVGGRLSRVNRRVGMSVRIINERFTDNQLAEKLYTMADHMERGGSVSFTVDTAKTYAAFGIKKTGVIYDLTATTEVYQMKDPLFDSISSTAPAENDVLLVESFGPDAKREEVRVHTYNATTKVLTIKTPLLYAHSGPTLFRHRDFFPVLYRNASETNAALTHDHRISWTWDINCEVYPAHLRELYAEDSTTITPSGGRTIDSIVGGTSADIGIPGDGLSDLPAWLDIGKADEEPDSPIRTMLETLGLV